MKMVGDAGFAPAIFCVWNSCSDWAELIPAGPSARTLTMISGFAGLRPIWLDDGGEDGVTDRCCPGCFLLDRQAPLLVWLRPQWSGGRELHPVPRLHKPVPRYLGRAPDKMVGTA